MEKEVLGIMVSYKIKIHLMVTGSGYVSDWMPYFGTFQCIVATY